jgi:hypothetical protein
VGDANGTQLRNMLGMTNLLLMVVVALLAWHVFHAPKPVGRFQPFREGARLALDTKTGKLCSTLPPRPLTDEEFASLQKGAPKEPQKIEIPSCAALE